MSIILPESYHGRKLLGDRRIHCISRKQAARQDIRPLRIGILNIMPKAEVYEFNLLWAMGRSLIQIDPVWIRLEHHAYRSSDREHIQNLYIPFQEAVREKHLDGLVLTGAPVEEMAFQEVAYWDEVVAILDYARKHIVSTLGICWGGLALANRLGLEKHSLGRKLFGVFETTNLDRNHAVTGDLDDRFFCPQSRHSGLLDGDLEAARDRGEIRLLARSDVAGYTIFESSDQRFLVHLGHPEYEADRLLREYERDRSVREDVGLPANLDPAAPLNIWRSHCVEFFTQWVKDCYIRTPY